MHTRHAKHVIIVGILFLFPQMTLASGGPTEEREASCAGTGANENVLVVFRLHQAYSSETRGDALVYRDGTRRGDMLTSMESCVEGDVAKPVPIAAEVPGRLLVICGNLDARSKELRPNNRGFRAVLWKSISKETKGRVERIEGGKATNVLGELTCTVENF
jgi:hypothetical protein